MPEITVPMYVESVSSATVTLEKELNPNQIVPAGTGVAMIVVTTTESTANSAFWGATGTCGRFNVTFEKV